MFCEQRGEHESDPDELLGEVIVSLTDQCSVEGSMIAFMVLFLTGSWAGWDD